MCKTGANLPFSVAREQVRPDPIMPGSLGWYLTDEFDLVAIMELLPAESKHRVAGVGVED